MNEPKEILRIAVFASTAGSDLPALFAMDRNIYNYVFFLTDKPDCGARKKAQAAGVPDIFLDPAGKTRQQYDAEILRILRKENIDLAILVGWMRLLSPELVRASSGKMINVHPSLLPAFAGGMDTNVHEQVLATGMRETGATVHFVTEQTDAGPVLLQKSCPILDDDTPETLKKRVQKLEQQMLPEAIEMFRLGKSRVL
jgi:phosphoribosylglycinamide formyltransferase-1